jgi:exodeoxyribonuclease-3
MTKIIAWNVNGIRSIVKKNDLIDLIEKEKPNIICFGETKLSCPSIDVESDLKDKITDYKYRYYDTCKKRGGYSGTAIFSKKKPIKVDYGMNISKHDMEGRVITLEFKKYFLIHVYTPNSGQALQRLDYRVKEWDIDFKLYLKDLQSKKPIIVCGDLNVANEEIDIHNPKGNKKSAGFTKQERENFKVLIKELDLIDTFRYINKDEIKYSYWSYMNKARPNNKGWRIDYFLVSSKLIDNVKKSDILTEILGSDHAPILLKFKID